MKVHLFGEAWSPSCAGYALRRTFQDHGQRLHEEIEKACRNFYVDDLLLSLASPGKEAAVTHQLRQLMKKGRFTLTKWICNHKGVLRAVQQTESATEVKGVLFKEDRPPAERALGIMWDLENDELAVRIQSQTKLQKNRGQLSMASSIYDPLEIIAPSTIRAKIIFQD
ncbi:uncharacterized protein LOC121877279 [Homarus americanus]|uniref:uncharacterized protein LOC121877279 n=1 Tax=Homarus americanus TaxID=6706 RepID=UPI001C441948|nr:uncharacterized protein LOC121877279 [Homarus americanus]